MDVPITISSIDLEIQIKGKRSEVNYTVDNQKYAALLVEENNRFDDSNFYLKLGYHGLYDNVTIETKEE